MAIKYSIGDKVLIKDIDWYNENKNKLGDILVAYKLFSHGVYTWEHARFTKNMSKYCGQILTISEYSSMGYKMQECIDSGEDFDIWTDEMIERLVEEESLIERVDDNGLPFNEWLSHKGAFYVPNGYEIKDEKGNIINTKKIVLEKRTKYPKTYEECCEVLGIGSYFEPEIRNATTEECHKFTKLMRLKRCRDAYWKLYGEEMELGKSWEPDWENNDHESYPAIVACGGKIIKSSIYTHDNPFAFPTPEMRDAFYENFEVEIKSCKELL